LRGFDAEDSFAEFVISQYSEGLLPNDDCTVIVVRVQEPQTKRASILGRRIRGSS